MAKRIHSVTIKRMCDSDPDTSYLGQYSDSSTSEFSIDRKHSLDCDVNLSDDNCTCDEFGDMGRGEYRYFNPSFNYVDKHGKLLAGNTAEEVRKYVRQDYERMEGLNNGSWCYLGIRSEATVTTGSGVLQEITSGGLWGIESDSDRAYVKEVSDEQLAELRDELQAIGFSKRAISAAFRDVEEEND